MKSQVTEFAGYSRDAQQFFKDLKVNNNKEWFDSHKDYYLEKIKNPSISLVLAMADRFAASGLNYVSDPKISMFRINRDIRFSKNKDPYKTNLGISFPYGLIGSSKSESQYLGLYFHLDMESTFIGGGSWAPSTDFLRSARKKIYEDWDDFEKIINNKQFKKDFTNGITGEALKKVPAGYPVDHPSVDYLKLKQYLVGSPGDLNLIFNNGLCDEILRKGATLAPLLDFLLSAL